MKFIQKRDEKREYVAEFYSQVRFDASVDFRPKAFLAALDDYINLKGNCIDEAYWLFFSHEISKNEPDSFDSGIEIRIAWPAVKEDIIIPLAYEEFYPMLCEECEKYLEERPEDRQQVQELLARIKVALNV